MVIFQFSYWSYCCCLIRPHSFYCDDTLWSRKSKIRVTPAVPERVLPRTHTLQGTVVHISKPKKHASTPTSEKSHTKQNKHIPLISDDSDRRATDIDATVPRSDSQLHSRILLRPCRLGLQVKRTRVFPGGVGMPSKPRSCDTSTLLVWSTCD